MRRIVWTHILLSALAMLGAACAPALEPLTTVPTAVLQVNGDEVALGRQLFFDKRLSRKLNVSCASCHVPDRGLADGKVFSAGTHGNALLRHTPAIVNVYAGKSFFWDGRAAHLEDQVVMPIESPAEMDMSLDELCARLNQVPCYRDAARRVYGAEQVTPAVVKRSLAAFLRTLVAYNSPGDRYLAGDTSALDEPAVRGLALFVGAANCVACHNGPNQTDEKFHNTGVITKDKGRMAVDRLGKREFDPRLYPFFSTYKAFKTPSLRNVARTAPYMHNGSKATLRDVVRFYNQGGESKEMLGRSPDVRPLGLTDDQIDDLVAFLESLSSQTPSPKHSGLHACSEEN